MDRGIIALGTATGKDHFAGIGVDERGNFGAGVIEMFGDLLAKVVGAGRVAPKLAQKRDHGINHLRSDPGGGVIIEVTNLPLAHTKAD
jgi:hypothetical protein